MEHSPGIHITTPQGLGDYITLTKPRIMVLLIITAGCAMIPAAQGWPPAGLMIRTLTGLACSIGGAHAVNMWYDRDIDRLMERTHLRPVPTGRIAPLEALWFGIFLESLSFMWLSVTVNPLSATLSLAGFLFYVVIYTLWLKRRSAQNIVIGGAAGAFPPLIGWAAVTDHLSWTAVIMFVLIVLWTPPHFWALAIDKQDDYRRAHLPMMPIVRGARATRHQMLIYSVLLFAATLLLYGSDPTLGPVYLLSALILGIVFTAAITGLTLGVSRITPPKIFTLSLAYTAGIFGAMVAGTLIH